MTIYLRPHQHTCLYLCMVCCIHQSDLCIDFIKLFLLLHHIILYKRETYSSENTVHIHRCVWYKHLHALRRQKRAATNVFHVIATTVFYKPFFLLDLQKHHWDETTGKTSYRLLTYNLACLGQVPLEFFSSMTIT